MNFGLLVCLLLMLFIQNGLSDELVGMNEYSDDISIILNTLRLFFFFFLSFLPVYLMEPSLSIGIE